LTTFLAGATLVAHVDPYSGIPIEILPLESTLLYPDIHGLWSGMVCTWRLLVEKFCVLLWQAWVGREIERYKREREEEMRKQRGGGQELLI
jgi:hypothetical protein